MGWQRYVAIGDSFTEGIGDPRPDGRDRGWADRVAEALGGRDPGFQYANLAIRGRKLVEIVEEQVPSAVELGPDLVSLAGGVNDALRRHWDLTAMTDALASGSRPSETRARCGARDVRATVQSLPTDGHCRGPARRVPRGHLRDRRPPRMPGGRLLGPPRVRRSTVLVRRPTAPQPRRSQRVSLAVLETLGQPVDEWTAPLPPVRPPSPVAGSDATWRGPASTWRRGSGDE